MIKKEYSKKDFKNHMFIIKTSGIDSPTILSCITNIIVRFYTENNDGISWVDSDNKHTFFHNTQTYIVCLTGVSTEKTKELTNVLLKLKHINNIKHYGYDTKFIMLTRYHNLINICRGNKNVL